MDSKIPSGFPLPKEAIRSGSKCRTVVTAALSVLAVTALVRGNFFPGPWSLAGSGSTFKQSADSEWTWSSVRRDASRNIDPEELTSFIDQAESDPGVAQLLRERRI